MCVTDCCCGCVGGSGQHYMRGGEGHTIEQAGARAAPNHMLWVLVGRNDAVAVSGGVHGGPRSVRCVFVMVVVMVMVVMVIAELNIHVVSIVNKHVDLGRAVKHTTQAE